MKIDQGVRALDVARELAQRLRHEPRLQAHVLVTHLALDLGLRGERRDRVDDDQVDCARAHEHVGDLERLLARVGLRDQEIFDLHADLLCVDRIERVLGVDERRGAAELLDLGDDLQREGGLARRLGSVDLDDAAARQAADAERDVEAERPRRDDVDVAHGDRVAEAHHGALAELFLDLAQRCGQRLLAVFVHRLPIS